MLVPFELFFLDTIDTIPPQSMHILTTSPALPLDCPLSYSALARPAIILWNTTNTLNTMEMIPLTSFHVFIKKIPFLKYIYNLKMGIIGMLVAYINGE